MIRFLWAIVRRHPSYLLRPRVLYRMWREYGYQVQQRTKELKWQLDQAFSDLLLYGHTPRTATEGTFNGLLKFLQDERS